MYMWDILLYSIRIVYEEADEKEQMRSNIHHPQVSPYLIAFVIQHFAPFILSTTQTKSLWLPCATSKKKGES